MTAQQSARLIGLAGAALGAFLGMRPHRVSREVSGGSSVGANWLRLLGARHLGQGIALLGRPTSRVLSGSAAVDGLHAASMVMLALASPAYRRPAALSAAVATASGTASGWTAGRLRREGR
ncbi:MAG: hypothetical protein ACR2JO_01810 [Mycobacteriales bacterium]